MLGHRKLTADDYLAILKRRRWTILVPALLCPIIGYGVSYFVPTQYLSQTLVLIEDQKVSSDVVKPVISTSLDSRLASMKEQILSRSRIQPIVERYNLFSSKRYTMDDKVDMTRKAITITPIRSTTSRTAGLPGFFIAFTGNDARTAQQVCGEITSLFVGANLKSREASAEGTTDFLKRQLEDAKRNLDDQDAKLAAFQRQYGGRLPGEELSNNNMLTSLNTRLETANQALDRMAQDKAYQESMLTQLLQNQAAGIPTAAPGQRVAPQTQQTELQSLLAQEADLSAHYTADYPDVIAIRRKIADLRARLASEANTSTEAANPGAPLSTAPHANDSQGVQQLRAQLRSSELGYQAKLKEQAQLQTAVREYQDRIQSSPQVQEQYKQITRDYETAQKFYDELLVKTNQSKMATDLERLQEGEQFRLMDEPNLPDEPSSPKRWMYAIGGFGGGLFLGLAIAGFMEYKNTALRTERDVWAFTQLPTLAVIAYSGALESASEKPGMFSRFRQMFSRRKPNETLTKAPV